MSPSTLDVGGRTYEIFRVEGAERLPYTLRILLENALRHDEDDDASALRRHARVFTVSTGVMDEHTSDEWIPLAPLTRLTEQVIELLSTYRAG